MAGDDRSTKPVGNQVAIMHPCPANDPWRLISKPPDDIAMLCCRRYQWRISLGKFNAHTIRCNQLCRAICQRPRIIHKEAKHRHGDIFTKGRIEP